MTAFILSLLALCGDAVAAELPGALPEDVGFSSERLYRVLATLRRDVGDGYIPGAVLLVARRGKIVLHAAVGWRDAEKRVVMTTDSIFRLHSMIQPITAAAALMLIEQGRLSLEDPVSTYIPELADMAVAVERGRDGRTARMRIVGAAGPITVHQLLTHTAGFTYEYIGDSMLKRRLRDEGVRAGVFDNAGLMTRLAALPLAHQPGMVFEYGYSFDVVGRVIEVISGESLYAFVKEQMLDPLDMHDTSYFVPEDKKVRIAEPLSNDRDLPQGLPDPSERKKWESGGDGMVSTARDYARFLYMLLNGGTLDSRRFLGQKTVDLMTSDHVGEVVRPGPFQGPGPRYGYGLGFAVRPSSGVSDMPGSQGEYGWGGDLGTLFWVDPVEQLMVVFMTQAHAHRARYRSLLSSMIYGAMME